jgi:hypothetical protein
MISKFMVKDMLNRLYMCHRVLAAKKGIHLVDGPAYLMLDSSFQLAALRSLIAFFKGDQSVDADTYAALEELYGARMTQEVRTQTIVGKLIAQWEALVESNASNKKMLWNRSALSLVSQLKELESRLPEDDAIDVSGEAVVKAYYETTYHAAPGVIRQPDCVALGKKDPLYVMCYTEGTKQDEFSVLDTKVMVSPSDDLHVTAVDPNFSFPDRGELKNLLIEKLKTQFSALGREDLFALLNNDLSVDLAVGEEASVLYQTLRNDLAALKKEGKNKALRSGCSQSFGRLIGQIEGKNPGLALFLRIKKVHSLGSFRNFFMSFVKYPKGEVFAGKSMLSIADWCRILPDGKDFVVQYFTQKIAGYDRPMGDFALPIAGVKKVDCHQAGKNYAVQECYPQLTKEDAQADSTRVSEHPINRLRAFLGLNTLSFTGLNRLHAALPAVTTALGFSAAEAVAVLNAAPRQEEAAAAASEASPKRMRVLEQGASVSVDKPAALTAGLAQ